MIDKIRVTNKYLNHILFHSGDEHLNELFEKIPGHVYTGSNNMTSLFLLHVIVQRAFSEQASRNFQYDRDKVKRIFLKPEFREAQLEMVNEVKRLYKETQIYLAQLPNEKYQKSSVRLYRRLAGYQQKQYFENFLAINDVKNEIDTNYLTSFHTSNIYYNGIVTVTAEIEKKNILFYDNLIPLEEDKVLSGFSLEGEALVRFSNNTIKYDYAYIDHQSKKLVDMENREYF